MKVSYDKSVDIVRVTFADSPVQESDEVRPGVIVDFDAKGAVVGIEILDGSERMPNPQIVEVALAA
ncbi:MAG: DUF2283 domain-containing protein [Pseudomonadota bacterium]